ncbi:MAG TPA: FlgD immunoglobulin-like domain containing protein, partial [Candidatus Udaeobacter sp.]|nr:FlgD immunoglobulin-like domain containing protein [Candidatus Udaeobacter sp.]
VMIRTILHDTGTPQAGTRLIGPRPRLGAAANAILSTTAVGTSVTAVPWRIESAPNPFSDVVRLEIEAPGHAAFRIGIYDAAGRNVRELGGMAGGGAQTIAWDGRDARGAALGAGVYFFKIEAPGFDRTVKVQKIH